MIKLEDSHLSLTMNSKVLEYQFKMKLRISKIAFFYIFLFLLKKCILKRHDYIRHPVERIAPHQPEQYKQPEGEMETMTSYSKEYIRKYLFKRFRFIIFSSFII